MRIGLYIRVSTAEQTKQNHLSLHDQECRLMAYAQNSGHEVVDIYRDAGVSGGISYKKRPEMMRLINDCQSGRVQLIAFTRIDRFFRSVKDYYFVQELTHDTPWISLDNDLDITTSAGRFMLNSMLSVAQMERDIDADRNRATAEYFKTHGWWIGKAPFGYRRIKDDHHHLEIDQNTSEVVKLIFDTFLSTYSVMATARKVGKDKRIVRNILKSPAYAGRIHDIDLPAYISWEQHEEILDVIQRRVRERKVKYSYLFSGLVYCGKCNHRMSGHMDIKPKSAYPRYICGKRDAGLSCTGQSFYESKLERYLLREIDDIIEWQKDRYRLSQKAVDDSEKRKKQIEDKLERLKNLYMMGDIELTDYKTQRDALRADLSRLEVKPIDLPALPDDWQNVYLDLDAEHRRAFWHSIIDKIFFNGFDNIEIVFK